MCYPAQATNNAENPNVAEDVAVVQNQPEPQDVVVRVEGVVEQNQHQIQDVAEEGVVFRLMRALRVRRRRRLRQIINVVDSDDDDEADYDWSNFISVRGFRYDNGF